MKRHHLQRRRAMRAKAGGGGSLFSESFSPSPALQSYLGAALAMAFSSFEMSFSAGAQASLFSGEPTTFSINTLAVSAAGGTHSVPGTFTHYVSAAGTGTWVQAENIATPCSPETALANAAGGDIIGFRGGTYTPDFSGASYEVPAYQPANSGSLGSPIIFSAYTGETPFILADPTTPNNLAFGAYGRNYIIWDGFHSQITDTAALGYYDTAQVFGFTLCSYCVLRNGDFEGRDNANSLSGGNNAPVWFWDCTFCEMYNCRIHDNYNGGPDGGGVSTCGIWIFASVSCLFHNNEFYNMEHGIRQKDSGNELCEIYLNYIHDILQHAMRFSEAGNTVTGGQDIHDNLIRACGAGILLGDQYPCLNYRIYNNTIVNVTGYAIGPYDAIGPEDLVCYNNILYGYGSAGFACTSGALPATLNYNCYYDAGGFACMIGATSYTTLANWRTAIGDEANSTYADPLFVNAAGTTPADFALQGGSPCIGTGLSSANMGVQNLALVGVQ